MVLIVVKILKIRSNCKILGKEFQRVVWAYFWKRYNTQIVKFQILQYIIRKNILQIFKNQYLHLFDQNIC